MEIRRVVLPVAAGTIADLHDFYTERGIETRREGTAVEVVIGRSEIVFTAAEGDPFHHFALQVPGDRFGAARSWIGARAPLLGDGDEEPSTFVFAHIDARAVYVHDPAGNIVELIAFADLDRTGAAGPFAPRELLGIAEIGLAVDDRPAAVAALAQRGLDVWEGAENPEGLQFVGRRAHSMILTWPGRGWMPTGRPAPRSSAWVEVDTVARREAIVVQGGRFGDG